MSSIKPSLAQGIKSGRTKTMLIQTQPLFSQSKHQLDQYISGQTYFKKLCLQRYDCLKKKQWLALENPFM